MEPGKDNTGDRRPLFFPNRSLESIVIYCVRNANNRAKLHETFTVKIEIYPPIAMATLIVYFERSLLTIAHQRGRFHALSHRYRIVSLLQRLIRLKMEAIRESMGPMALHYLEHVTSSGSDFLFRLAFIAETLIYPPLETIDLFEENQNRYLRESVGH